MLTIDNFLHDPMGLRRGVLIEGFGDVLSPTDQVVYPGICPVSGHWLETVQGLVEVLFGNCSFYDLFARLCTGGVDAPHRAHNDETYGTHTLLLGLTLDCDLVPGAGTSLVSHADTGMAWDTKLPEDVAVWQRDTNIDNKWNVDEFVPMGFNKANFIPAARYHRAEPTSGFGSTPENGRLMLVQFFTPEAR